MNKKNNRLQTKSAVKLEQAAILGASPQPIVP
jgi:hypothetical protein